MSDTLFSRFWQATYHDPTYTTGQQKGETIPLAEPTEKKNASLIFLPEPTECTPSENSFIQLVAQRRTQRKYEADLLSLEELSYLLWATQGVQKTLSDERSLRTAPSAGARHALDTYLLIFRVHQLSRGLYRYIPSKHALEEVNCSPAFMDTLVSHFRNVALLTGSAVTFMWISDTQRMTWKFGPRGYRYLLLDAGHICQNAYLAAETINCGCCAIGSFDDHEINTTLGFTDENHFLVYAASIGRQPKKKGKAQ